MTNSRQKGAAGEREAAKLWQKYYPHCKRQFPCQQQGVQMPDIGCPEMNKLFYVEVKRYKKINAGQICKWFDKVDKDFVEYRRVFKDGSPKKVIMIREDNDQWLILAAPRGGWLPYDTWADFCAMLENEYGLEAK